MIWWEKAFKRKLTDLNIVNELLERYIDDINLICNAIPSGLEYKEGRLCYNEEKEKEN